MGLPIRNGFDDRCPTMAVRIDGHTPLELADKLGDRGFFTWDGNYYAINLSEQLDVEKDGGFLRIGLAHYNTPEEVDRLLAASAKSLRQRDNNFRPGCAQKSALGRDPSASEVARFTAQPFQLLPPRCPSQLAPRSPIQ